MQKTLIIGDIHGCYFELQALLDKAGLSDGDRIIGIGDIVDRGPETPAVVDFFKHTPNARSIMGNHERKHVRAARQEVKLSISQIISQSQFGDAYPAALEWMAGLPLFIELKDAILVHGYFEPGIPPELQDPSVLCGTMGGDKILAQRYARPWYELYNADKPVIVGHANYTQSDQPFVYGDKIYGLDTNCVTGKALTGILLPAFQFVSVPSRGNLWGQVRAAYEGAPSQASAVRSVIEWTEADNQQLDFLLQKLQDTNNLLMSQVQDTPGYVEMTPPQQTRLYAELVGAGTVANLLQLTRQGKLNAELMHRIVRDPQRLSVLIEDVLELSDSE